MTPTTTEVTPAEGELEFGSLVADRPTFPVAQPPKRRRTFFAALRRWIVFLAVIAGCVYLAQLQISKHETQVSDVGLLQARMAADPVEVRSTVTGQVMAVNVTEDQSIQDAATLITIQTVNPITGKTGVADIASPVEGRATEIAVLAGDSVRPGDLLVDMVEPSAVYVMADVPNDRLGDVRRGMIARLKLPSGVTARARVVSLEPRMAGDDGRPDTSRIRLKPLDQRLLRLVPGVPLEGTLDGASTRKSAPSVATG